MTIQWNTVTWYSKAIALVVFVGTFAIAFWLGAEYGTIENTSDNDDASTEMQTTSPEPSTPISEQSTPENPDPEPSVAETPTTPRDAKDLPNATVGEFYTTSLSFDYSKDPRGTDILRPESLDALPSGFTLTPQVTGSDDEPRSEAVLDALELSGTPTSAGTFVFTIVYNDDPYYAETYSLIVVE